MSEHIPNRDLTLASIPPPDASFADVLVPFAMSYHAYDIWGDFETVRDAAEAAWASLEQTEGLPASLAKLRLSLFAAARSMRTTDFDEDIAGTPGSEAAWIQMMRDHIAAITQTVELGNPWDLPLANATRQAAADIADHGTAKEHELTLALGRSLAGSAEPVVHERRFEHLPLWALEDPPGPFDIVVGKPGAPVVAVEVKLSDHNTLSHSLWDIIKLLGVLALSADVVYLVAGYPTRIWQRATFAKLYTTGTTSLSQLPIEKEWPSLLQHSKGTPLRIPNAVEVREVACAPLTRGSEPWEIRSVAIEPATGGWIELRNGALDGAQPYQPA